MRGVVQSAGEKEVLRLQTCGFDPFLKRIARGGSNLKLHRTLRFVLHDDGGADENLDY